MRVGVIGKRGLACMKGILCQPGTRAEVFCEANPETLEKGGREYGFARTTSRYEELVERCDAVVIGTPMHLHAEQTVLALQAGKHVLCEVTAAMAVDECWQIADAASSTNAIYMLAENYCYLKECVLVRAMVRQGLFGFVTFGHGAYLHDVKDYHYTPDGKPTWRAYYQVGIDGCTYGTHSLGPVMQWMKECVPDDRIISVVCLGSGRWTQPEHRQQDTTITLVRLRSGRLIEIRLDMLSNRPPHATKYGLQGTQGAYECGPVEGEPGLVWLDRRDGVHRSWEPIRDYESLLPKDWMTVEAEAAASGHGGGDFRVGRDFIRAARGEISVPIPWQDGLEWTAAGLASTTSIENGGVPIQVPDFTDMTQAPAWLRHRREID